jgi:hypothetical protein
MLDLQQFYDACDPTQPLRGKRYYIDFSTVRGGDIVQELERKIARLARNRPTTQLFTGHIGCGKSTELFRLQMLWCGAATRWFTLSQTATWRWPM